MRKYVVKIKEEKSEIIRIIVFSVVLSTVINLVSNAICSVLEIHPAIQIIAGFVVTLVLLISALAFRLHKLNTKAEFEGMIIIGRGEEGHKNQNSKDNDDNESYEVNNRNSFVFIPDYDINNNMHRHLLAAFVENDAIKKVWENGDLKSVDSILYGSPVDPDESVAILIELIEYAILDNLSMFTWDYLNGKESRIEEEKWTGESLPSISFANRFIRLFSEDIINRPVFGGNDNSQKCKQGFDVFWEYSENGALYEKFELILPKGTTITRKSKNSIGIDTKLFELTIEYCFNGCSAAISDDFTTFYVGEFEPSKSYLFSINISLRYKWTSVFSPINWKYYEWIDEYINQLEDFCDKDAFLRRIGWDVNEASLRMLVNTKKWLCEKEDGAQ